MPVDTPPTLQLGSARPPVFVSCKAKTRLAAAKRSNFFSRLEPASLRVTTCTRGVHEPGRRWWWWFGSARQSETNWDWLRPRRGWGSRSWGRTLGLWRQASTPNFWPLRPPAPRDFFGVVGRHTIQNRSSIIVLSQQRPRNSGRCDALLATQSMRPQDHRAKREASTW